MVTCDRDRGEVDVELEVHGLCGVPRLAHELAALDVEANQEPAHYADERADDSRKEVAPFHAVRSIAAGQRLAQRRDGSSTRVGEVPDDFVQVGSSRPTGSGPAQPA